MQIKLVLRRFPFYKVEYYDGYSAPFSFEPRLFEYIPGSKRAALEQKMTEIVEELGELKKVYEAIKEKFNVQYIEIEKEIMISENQLREIIQYAKQNGLELRPYAEFLPKLTEQEFEEAREKARKRGYKKVLAEYI